MYAPACLFACQVAFGSYHAITDMMPSLAVRYPYMCYQFLAQLELAALGEPRLLGAMVHCNTTGSCYRVFCLLSCVAPCCLGLCPIPSLMECPCAPLFPGDSDVHVLCLKPCCVSDPPATPCCVAHQSAKPCVPVPLSSQVT